MLLGRKDSLKSSFNGANQFIPAPNSSLESLIDSFKAKGLDMEDLVALSGTYPYSSNLTETKFHCTREDMQNLMQPIIIHKIA